jgi:hypothetical protein
MHDHVFTLMFYIAYAYGNMMKVASLFYLHEVIHVLDNLSVRKVVPTLTSNER